MAENIKRKLITFGFNFALFVYIIYAYLIAYLFEAQSDKRSPIDYFYDIAPGISMTVCALMIMFLILMAALIIHEFWNMRRSSLLLTVLL
jgi:ABC-type spermidine/putrescine transport system permease subunit II